MSHIAFCTCFFFKQFSWVVSTLPILSYVLPQAMHVFACSFSSATFPFNHLSWGHRVVNIYERCSGSLSPSLWLYVVVKLCEDTALKPRPMQKTHDLVFRVITLPECLLEEQLLSCMHQNSSCVCCERLSQAELGGNRELTQTGTTSKKENWAQFTHVFWTSPDLPLLHTL